MKAGSWAAILLIFFYGALAPATIGQLVPTIADLARELGISRAQAGWIVSSPAAVPALLGLLGGWLVDKLSERPVLIGSAIALLSGNLIVLISDDVPILLAARFIEGAAYLGLTVAGASLMVRTTSGARQTSAMALWGTFVPVGFGLSIFLVAIFHQSGWRIGFVGLGVLAVLAVAATPLLPAPPASARAPGRATGLMDVVRKATAFRLGASFAANALLQTGLATAFPQYLAATFGLSHGTGGMVTTGQMATNTLATLAVGYMLNRGVTSKTIATAGTLIGLTMGLLMFLPGASLALSITAAMIFTVGTGLITGLASALLPRAAPSPQTMGATSGLVFQLVLIGVLVGPPLVFGALDPDTFTALAGLIFVTSVLTLVLMPIWKSQDTIAGFAPSSH